MTIVVTGATGFVGGALARRLLSDGHQVITPVRRSAAQVPPGGRMMVVPPLAADTDWSGVVRGADVVVHAAARVHVMRDAESDPLSAFRLANVAGTRRLAEDARRAGVRRFVFVSSIKVNGEATREGAPCRADDPPRPSDPYGISKAEAEALLLRMHDPGVFEVVIVRPVLVYGRGAKGNFPTLVRWVSRGVPLPLGAVRNRRSLVALDNLVDLLATCCRHPDAGGHVFLVSDGEDVSTTDLLVRVGRAVGRPSRLVAVPQAWLRTALRLAGKTDVAARLLGSLQVDDTPTRATLSWMPPVSLDEGLRRAVTSSTDGAS